MTSPSTDRPNILLIISDQQSLDTMSWMIGERYISTPALDGLALKGMTYTNAYCANPLCVPSRTAMFTGYHPHETGVLTNNDNTIASDRFVSIGKLFREAGYDTGYTGKWHASIPDSDWPIRSEDSDTHGFVFCENGMNNGADIHNAEMAERFLSQERDNPFFLVVSFNNPHNICEWARGKRGNELPDAALDSPPEPDRLPPLRENHTPAVDESDAINLLRRSFQATKTFPVGGFGEREWREYIWAYYRMVESIDRKIGQVMRSLTQSGVEENTVIVFVSDHGDCQGAHQWNQKTVFYDEASKVPLIISTLDRQGMKSDRLVNTGVDLAPTLLNLAGIPVPAGLHGVDLLDGTEGGREYIVCSDRFVQGAPIDGQETHIEGRMVRSVSYKYSVFQAEGRNEELYDMVNDPLELTNLAGDLAYAEPLCQHREYLRDFGRRTGDDFPDRVKLG